MGDCKAGLPAQRTDWNQLQPSISTAIKNFVAIEDTVKLLKMRGNERTLVANLKVSLETEFARKYGNDVWSVNNDHTRVLEDGTPKKQPTDYLLEAIGSFRHLRDADKTPFGIYLKQFSLSKQKQTKDEFYLACADIIDASRKLADDDIDKNITTPDLIIHEIGCLTKIEHNLIAFEIKPYWAKPEYEKLIDLARLKAFTQTKITPDQHITPTYQYGLFLYLSKDGFEYGWRFENGIDEPVEFKLDD